VKFGFRTEAGMSDIEGQFPLATRSALQMDPTMQMFCARESSGGTPCGRYIKWDDEVARINNNADDFSLPPQRFLGDFGISSAPNYQELTGLFLATPWPDYRDPVGQVITPQGYSNSTIDMRGKINNTGVYASVANLQQQGAITQLEGFTRNSARINVDQRFGDRISGNINSYYSESTDHAGHLDETGSGGPWFNITRAPWMSDMTLHDINGRVVVRSNPLAQGEQNYNPLYSVVYNQRTDKNTRFVGGSSLKYTPLDWLNIEGTVGYDRSTNVYTQQRERAVDVIRIHR
jgi:hypothetical protein